MKGERIMGKAKPKAKKISGPQCARCAKEIEGPILTAEAACKIGGAVYCLPKRGGPSVTYCTISCAVAE